MSQPTDGLDAVQDLEIARGLVRAGVPVFVARFAGWGQGTSGCGFWLPKHWPLTQPDEAIVDGWRPGDALAAVMGTKVDLLDVDPHNGGDASRAELVASGQWPRSYGRAVTPSGGAHYFIPPLGVGSRDGFAPGLDHKGGRHGVPVLSAGRGFAFIAPTVKPSKLTGELIAYVWDELPDFELIADGLEQDAAAVDLAQLIASIKGTKTLKDGPEDGEAIADPMHSGPIPDGQRHEGLVRYAGKLRGRGLSFLEARALMYQRWLDCAQPDKVDNPARYPVTWDEAVEKLKDVFDRYAPEPERGVATLVEGAEPLALGAVGNVLPLRPGMPIGQPSEDAEAAALEAELAFNREVAEQVHRLKVLEEAKRQIKLSTLPAAPPAVTLPDLLAEPEEVISWRVADVFPVGGRVVLAAQRKAGKTTLTANLVRTLADGGLFLDRWHVEPVARKVTVLDFEMSRHMLKTWLSDQAIAMPERVNVWPMRGKAAAFDITTAAVRRQWIDRLIELETDFLVVDCLRPILDAIGLEEKSEAGRFLEALDALAVEAGIAEMLLVHHAGHLGERSRGDSRLRDWPDAEWRLVREASEDPAQEPGPDAKRFFIAEGRDVAVPESALGFDSTSRRLTLVGGNRKSAKAETHYPTILEVAHEGIADGGPGYTGAQIEALVMAKSGAARAVVRQALGEMVDKNQLVRVPGARTAAFYRPAGVIQLAAGGQA